MRMPAVKTARELYPPSTPDEVAAILREVMEGHRAEDGRAMLRRALVGTEREMLKAHAHALDAWTGIGKPAAKAEAITGMLMGFGGPSMAIEDAKEIAVQYSATCGDVPWWAVERACHRFATGQVRPEEIGEKTISITFRPSTAQLYRVASTIAGPTLQTRFKIGEALRGVAMAPTATMTPEQRAAENVRMDAAVARWKEKSVMNAAGRQLAEMEDHRKAQSHAQALAELAEQSRLREFRTAGVEPPATPPGGIPITLSMMLRHGYRIEEVEGRNVLVRPGVESKFHRAARAPQAERAR